jgi:hypothetical protein
MPGRRTLLPGSPGRSRLRDAPGPCPRPRASRTPARLGALTLGIRRPVSRLARWVGVGQSGPFLGLFRGETGTFGQLPSPARPHTVTIDPATGAVATCSHVRGWAARLLQLRLPSGHEARGRTADPDMGSPVADPSAPNRCQEMRPCPPRRRSSGPGTHGRSIAPRRPAAGRPTQHWCTKRAAAAAVPSGLSTTHFSYPHVHMPRGSPSRCTFGHTEGPSRRDARPPSTYPCIGARRPTR